MATGDKTYEVDERGVGGVQKQPVAGLKLEIVVANGTSSKTEKISINMVLTDLYFNVPAIVTGVANKAKVELLKEEDDNSVYSSGNLAAVAATKYSAHDMLRGLRNKTTIKVTTDGNVNADETFSVIFDGV